ncbi:uncharacterized protein LOC104582016 [Brachypodium distachyon]|uniref:uncharacterized protein LOC104582016 n=1 Tax=Brachypodium distachyon TaxID=15368 RepID=UPI0001D42D14|nr:uncharacterized protein LOC104582016 [Brachypodium distachyon]|eukprot:XP_010229572.1 uncharacterized protein LOC104582016 [Brachypodium distachyon]
MSTPPPLKKMHYADGEVHLDEGVVGEILLRLPAASLLRCRAVCTAWRRLADSPEFLAAHARHRPVEILLYKRFEVGPDGVRRQALYGRGDEVHLDALAVVPGSGSHRRRRLARYPVVDKNPEYLSRPYCSLVASCDGLLLLGRGAGSGLRPYDPYLVCNPATRQWTQLPRLTAAAGEQPLGIVPAHLEVR